MHPHTLTFQADPLQIEAVHSFLDGVIQAFELSSELAQRIRLGVTEAANNAIIHGSLSDPQNTIVLQVNRVGSWLRISIKDQGNGFDPDIIPDPTLQERLNMESGRGVFLMKQVADEVVFQCGGREVILKFTI